MNHRNTFIAAVAMGHPIRSDITLNPVGTCASGAGAAEIVATEVSGTTTVYGIVPTP